MTPNRQIKLFRCALGELATLDDLINQALEVIEDESGAITIYRYDIPMSCNS